MLKAFYIKYIQKIYRFIVPHKVRKKLENRLFGVSTKKLRKKIIRSLSEIPTDKITHEEIEVLDFLKRNPLQIFPYNFTKNSLPQDHQVIYDQELNLHFVYYENKKLYFKRSWSVERIQIIFNNLLIEQHQKSPHCYLSDDFEFNNESTLIDIGVAEGNFALSVIEKAKKIYLFEYDEEWIEALNATFAPWKEKVIIVNKWVSDVDDEKCVTIDNYFKNIDIDFIKIDVDGSEKKLLNGSRNILENNSNLKVAICTYHNQDDQLEFSTYFQNINYSLSHSYGFMIFWWGEIKPPYIRRGVLRATKGNHG